MPATTKAGGRPEGSQEGRPPPPAEGFDTVIA
jgi:hypothetical protein